jgi:ATP-dependent Clp protease ATP-binding subunit ClpA
VQGSGKINGQPLNSPKLIRFHELTEDEYFCTEDGAKAGVTFENTSETEPLVCLRYFGPEVNPDAPAMGAYRKNKFSGARASGGSAGSKGLFHRPRAALEALLADREVPVRMRGCKAAAGQPAFRDRLSELAQRDDQWGVRQAAIQALGEVEHPRSCRAPGAGDCGGAGRRCPPVGGRSVGEGGRPAGTGLPRAVFGAGGAALIKALSQLEGSWGGARCPGVKAWLKRRTESLVDIPGLARFGTDMTAQLETAGLPRAFEVGDSIAMLLERLQREPARPLALVGRSGCGKTALVNELVRALALPENGGWRVLRMAPADFLTGTKYVGEWETRVRDLVAAIRHPRRVLVYVPNLADLAAVGRSEKSDANVAAALAPHLEEGSIRLIGESTPEEFERGLGKEPALVRLFERVLVEPATVEGTRQVVRAMRDHDGIPATDGVLNELVDASEFYLSHIARPGGAAGLLRAVMEGRRGNREPVRRRDILVTLSQSTGVPVDLLDDTAPLDLERLRGFFEARIIGQSDAVEAVVDLVTLVKAGVTDPNKPFGVMLFVGPTGVGKTELARVLAEYIFGDPGRLVRFDMSEFASPDGFTRLIGGRGENGLLTDAVRQRPFSVILLDEIEKSHVNVFDLCLQIFDAGRLTDGHGRLVDFRRSIVILTSNVGAESPVAEVGFGGRPGPQGLTGGASNQPMDAERTFRELTRFFRPEFLNRLDRIVHFAPLSIDVAERIARRELDLVLQRSGVARRNLSVSVDPGVIALLVREGYSPHFGARPLKRTVERMVLLPLGRALATGPVGCGGPSDPAGGGGACGSIGRGQRAGSAEDHGSRAQQGMDYLAKVSPTAWPGWKR